VADTSHEQLGKKFLSALQQHDWLMMRLILHADIIWSLPGESRIAGEARGPVAVIERSKIITSYKLNFRLIRILYGRHGFALSLNNTASQNGKVLDEHLATVCTVRDGKISRIDTYLSDVSMANSFFSTRPSAM
jgi:ketosteroid isomerase-like protein